jgi:hypothetical protein
MHKQSNDELDSGMAGRIASEQRNNRLPASDELDELDELKAPGDTIASSR